MILKRYSPEEYAALWGCEPKYDHPPRKPGDGALFYNFGSERQIKDAKFLTEFVGAIHRTIHDVRSRESLNNSEDLKGLGQLLEHVKELLAAVPKKRR